jgi:hypothetical protein
VVKQDGKPVTDAAVAVTFRMPAMPSMNMPEMHSTTPLAHEGEGRYTGTGQLEMTGDVERDGHRGARRRAGRQRAFLAAREMARAVRS